MNLFIWSVITFNVLFTETDHLVKELRQNYQACSRSEALCNKMIQSIPANSSETLNGYKGALVMMKASFAWMPYDKLAFFNQGKDILESAIAKEPHNLELRYIRLSVQREVPAMLQYNHMTADRNYLKNHVDLLSDKELKQMIKDYLKQF